GGPQVRPRWVERGGRRRHATFGIWGKAQPDGTPQLLSTGPPATAVDFSVDNFAEKPAGFFSCTAGGFCCHRSYRTRWGMSRADPQRSPQGAHKLAGRPSTGCPQDRVGRRCRVPPECQSPLVRRCLTKELQACNLGGGGAR